MLLDRALLTERLREHVQRLARVPRPPGSAAHAQARDYIRDHLQQAGFVVETAVHDEGSVHCENLLTRPYPGDLRLPLVIVAAHYDSVPDSPGADDNASAVAALLEVASWLGPRLASLEARGARLQLASYDLEVYGLIGSHLHARELADKKTDLRAMIALEMLGYTDARPGSQRLPPALVGLYPNIGNFIGVVGNEASASLLRLVVGQMKTARDLPVESMAVPGDGSLLRETRLSDHSAFWDHGFPALMITDTSFFRNPHYHTPRDTPETLDYEFLAKVTSGLCVAVARLLQVADLGPQTPVLPVRTI